MLFLFHVNALFLTFLFIFLILFYQGPKILLNSLFFLLFNDHLIQHLFLYFLFQMLQKYLDQILTFIEFILKLILIIMPKKYELIKFIDFYIYEIFDKN